MALPPAPRTSTSFSQLSAVDTWDSVFRWRDRGKLRDLTIDDSWSRVGQWLAQAESDSGSYAESDSVERWANRFVTAFANWQLLPDEALLRFAGTDLAPHFDQAPLAVVNTAAFACGRDQRAVQVDHAGVAGAAALGVRVLDDALMLSDSGSRQPVRIGLIGMADTFERLHIPFDSPAAVATAVEVARDLLHGGLQGALDLTLERGGAHAVSASQLGRWGQAGVDPDLLAAVSRRGLRRTPITGLFAASRLARLANGRAEGTDPGRNAAPTHAAASLAGRSTRVATEVQSRLLAAQLRLRAAMQPWLDAPINQPMLVDSAPSDDCWRATLALASRLELPVPHWRCVEPEAGVGH
jgi:ribonucleoside-diphosphate reductase alpha chain